MKKHSIENFRLTAYSKFSKILTSWTKNILYIYIIKKKLPQRTAWPSKLVARSNCSTCWYYQYATW